MRRASAGATKCSTVDFITKTRAGDEEEDEEEKSLVKIFDHSINVYSHFSSHEC